MIRILGLSACALGATALAARFLDVTNHAILILAVLSPYVMVAIPIGTAALMVGRHWIAAGCAGLLTVGALTTQMTGRAERIADPVIIRVLSVNTLQGNADARALTDLARSNADVVSLQELTPDGLAKLGASGIDAAFPHRITKPLNGGSGAGLWSRYELHESPEGEFEGVPILAQVDIPGASPALSVAVVHLSAPWPWPIEWWRADIAQATTTLRTMPTDAVVAAGDFNSTRDMAQFRRLLDVGFSDATARTYPADRWFPPLMAIDHILTRGCSTSSMRTVAVAGSDHRALVARVELPAE